MAATRQILDAERLTLLLRQLASMTEKIEEAKETYREWRGLCDKIGSLLDPQASMTRGKKKRVRCGGFTIQLSRPKGGYKFYADYEVRFLKGEQG